ETSQYGIPPSDPPPVAQIRKDHPDIGLLRGRLLRQLDGEDAQERDEERQGIDVEGERDLVRLQRGQETGRRETDGGRAERRDRQERVRLRQLLLAGDLGEHALPGRIEELPDGRRE